MKLKNILLVIGISISSLVFSQKDLVNKNYQATGEHFKLALIPVYNQRPEMNDEILAGVFGREPENLEIINPAECRRLLDSDSALTAIVNKLVLKKYRWRQLKKFPGMETAISPEELNYLKTKLNNADLLLLPISFELDVFGKNETRGVVEGYSDFRFYDLNTGEFILEFSHRLRAPRAGEKGIRGMTTALMVVTHKHVRDSFIDKFVRNQ